MSIEIFFSGFAGSVAVDIVSVAQIYNADHIFVPERYRRVAFYVVRFLLAVVAGGLAVAYEIDKMLLAVNVGAATPLIIQAFSQGLGHVPRVGGAPNSSPTSAATNSDLISGTPDSVPPPAPAAH
jgi:hypothetical protein